MKKSSWRICFRGEQGPASFGLELVSAAIQEYEGYIPAVEDSIPLSADDDLVLLMVREGNACEVGQMDAIAGQKIPSGDGYLLSFKEHPFCEGRKMILIASETARGLMYGCVDFVGKYLPRAAQAHQHNPDYYYFKNPFREGFADGACVSAPAVEKRGFWTWGHVIYDYRAFFDHMTMCRLNEVTIWNDNTPDNAREVYEYAHSRGINVIWGLSLNWDEKEDIAGAGAIEKWAGIALKKCRALYGAGIADGVYVQTFTETRDDSIGGMSIAENAVKWINTIYRTVEEAIPGIDFRFGLHATSVMNRLDAIEKVDPRVSIVWEDAGQFPYNYVPETDIPGFMHAMDSTRKITALRDGRKAGATLKGLCCLDWKVFRHMTGPQRIGCASKAHMDGLMAEKRRIWRYVQSHWMVNAEACREVVAEFRKATDGQTALSGLVEDSLFDREIWFPAALFAAILWDCGSPVEDLIVETAQRPYVTFA